MAEIASGSIDLKSLEEASKVANNLFSVDDSGIMVYNGAEGIQMPSSPNSDTNNVFIDDDSLDIRKGTNVLATFGADETRIGGIESSNIGLGNRSIVARKSDGSKYFNVGLIGQEQQSVDCRDYSETVYGCTHYFNNNDEWQSLYDTLGDGDSFYLNVFIAIKYKGSSSSQTYNQTYQRNLHLTCNKGTATSTGGGVNEPFKIYYTKGFTASQDRVQFQVNQSTLREMFPNGYLLDGRSFIFSATINTTTPAYSFGINTEVEKKLGFAMGNGTIPSEIGLALGKYNKDDTNDEYPLIIGNGTRDNARSNAFAITWDGNVEIDLANYQSQETTVDKTIYEAIDDLTWSNDVLIT